MYSAGTQLYATKDNVAYYAVAGDLGSIVRRSGGQYSDPVRSLDASVGSTTGNSKTVGQLLWIEVNWVNSYVLHGVFGFKKSTENEARTSWVMASDVKDVTSDQIAAQAAKDAAAAKAKQQQALIDVVGGGNNANLTASSGTTTSNNSIYWIVGGVLVFIAGLVIWKVASKPKAVAAMPTVSAPAVPKPTKLR